MAGTKAGDITYDIHGNIEPLKRDLAQAQNVASESGGGGSGSIPKTEAEFQLEVDKTLLESRRKTASMLEGIEVERQIAEMDRVERRKQMRMKEEADDIARAQRETERLKNLEIARNTGGGKVSFSTAEYAKVDNSIKGLRKSFTEASGEAMKWLGVAGLIAGTATTFYTLGNAIYEGVVSVLEKGTDKAKSFKESLDLSDVEGSLKSYTNELASLDAEMAERKAGTVKGWYQSILKSDATLQEEINAKRADRQTLAQTAEARRQAVLRDKAKKESDDKAKEEAKQYLDTRTSTLDKLQSETRSAELDMMDERKRAAEESSDKIDALDKEFRKLSFADQMKYEAQFDAARTAINAAYFAKKRKWQEEDTKKQLEDAKKVSDAWVSSFRSIREASNSVFSTDQAASMVQFSQQMMVSATIAHANMNRIVVEGVG